MNQPKRPMLIHPEGHCYVLLRGNWIHPIAHRRFDLLWYPETAMTMLERHNYRPYVKSIVTEDPWLIGLYDVDNVRVVEEDGSWQLPNSQTYAASVNNTMLVLLGIRSTIPAQTLDGGKEIQKWIDEYANRVKLANELYGKA